MSDYKYTLEKWNERDKSLRCPRCGRGHGCYKQYLLADGTPVDNESHLCGKCDHETTCGYHLTPTEFYKMRPEQRRDVVRTMQKEQKQKAGYRIERHWVTDCMTAYNINNFVKWLWRLPWDDVSRGVIGKNLAMYGVGTTRDGRTIWWQIDELKQIRTGKIMAYNETDGHRMKDAEGNAIGMNWMHRVLGMDESKYELQQCLFGLHLISEPGMEKAEVHIVESEKTAFLMSVFDSKPMSERVWMACGGLYNMKGSMISKLKGHTVYAWPDANGVERWESQLKDEKDVHIYTDWMKSGCDGLPNGYDIADKRLKMLLMSDEAKLDAMVKKNPMLQELINELDLEICKRR